MRILGRIVEAHSAEQSVGIIVGAFAPTSYLQYQIWKRSYHILINTEKGEYQYRHGQYQGR